jgi:hypothetical protein
MAVTTPEMRQIAAMREIAEAVAQIDPVAAETLAKLSHPAGVPPNSTREPARFGAFLAEAIAALAKAFEEQTKVRPRGRPPKAS